MCRLFYLEQSAAGLDREFQHSILYAVVYHNNMQPHSNLLQSNHFCRWEHSHPKNVYILNHSLFFRIFSVLGFIILLSFWRLFSQVKTLMCCKWFSFALYLFNRSVVIKGGMFWKVCSLFVQLLLYSSGDLCTSQSPVTNFFSLKIAKFATRRCHQVSLKFMYPSNSNLYGPDDGNVGVMVCLQKHRFVQNSPNQNQCPSRGIQLLGVLQSTANLAVPIFIFNTWRGKVISHFRVILSLCFKTSLGAQPFIWKCV